MDGHRKRAGVAVRTRRTELGLRQQDMKQVGGPSTDTMRRIENGMWDETSSNDGTIEGLEAALGWKFGSYKAILEGGHPTLADVETVRVVAAALEGFAVAGGVEGDWVALPRWMFTELLAELSQLSLLTRGRDDDVARAVSRAHTLGSDMLALVMAAERSPEELKKLLERLTSADDRAS